MPAKVLAVKESKWKRDGQDMTTYFVTLDDKTDDVPCYDAQAATLKIGEPLPEGWEVATSKAGKLYLRPPKQAKGGSWGSGGGSWRNSEAGERFVQERMDRRTALMQAVEVMSPRLSGSVPESAQEIGALADGMYEWLRASGTPQEPISGGTGVARGTSTDPKATKSVEGTTVGPVVRAPVPSTDNVDGGGHTVDPLAGTTPPSADLEETGMGKAQPPEAKEVGAEAHGLGDAPASDAVHVHEWGPAPRDGWQLCKSCGAAEKVKVSHG